MFKLASLVMVLGVTVGCRSKLPTEDTSDIAVDEDMDGFVDSEDCNDNDATINPDAEEVCDEVDNNCDGQIDEGVETTFYTDSDSDGYGDDEGVTLDACEAPEGMVDIGGDCDDSDAAFNPGAAEDDCADPNDYNCDGSVGYADEDGDGFAACEECDDTVATTYPGADEYCDGVDNDCDSETDEDDSVDASTWYADTDGDAYGDANTTDIACYISTGWVADSTDCDDTEATTYPGADEYCDGVNNDCDSETDEDDSVDASTWYADTDGDTYGDANNADITCYISTGWVADNTDCDDSSAAAYPGGVEVCDSLDNDCDGTVDNDAEVLGEGSACPGADCEEIYTTRTTSSTANYWIDPDASGTSFETFCDMSNEGGGWTLVANIDDVSDPWLLAQDSTWESLTLRNETVFPSYSVDLSVTTKYESWTTIEVTDMYIYYKNDGAYFLCEGLDVNDTLSNLFSIIPAKGDCASQCTYYSENRMPTGEGTGSPVGLNCNDPNEGWMSTPSYSHAENSRVGGLADSHTCCVMNAWIGAAGDRGFSTSNLNKTWGAYYDGEAADDNIMVFVR
jgi:hypothetical protein